MKLVFAQPLLLALLTTGILHAAADSDLATSPGGTSLTGYISSLAYAAYGWGEKKLGTKTIAYCSDKTAQLILKNTELRLELALADNRAESKTKTYAQLMNEATFQQQIKQLNDRAYFEWEHVKNAIAEDRFSDIVRFWKHNRINLSPCLRTAIRIYLEQEHIKQRAAQDPKMKTMRFDLDRINTQTGYIEATAPIIEQESKEFHELMQIMREDNSTLTISSPLQSGERRVRKAIDPSFPESYLREIAKALQVYRILFTHMFLAKHMGQPISDLFRDNKFLGIYNQAWDRDTHLRYVFSDLLKRGSLDACSIYAHHKQNVAPLYAVLICDMILSHRQQEHANIVPKAFKTLFLEGKKPYGKYIFMFLNNLRKRQKIMLYNAHEEIAKLEGKQQSPAIHRAVGLDDKQMHLLAEIERSGHMRQLLEAIRTARADIDTDPLPELSAAASFAPIPSPEPAHASGDLVLALDLPVSPSTELPSISPKLGSTELRSAGESDED
jgi:hypothetical protein